MITGLVIVAIVTVGLALTLRMASRRSRSLRMQLLAIPVLSLVAGAVASGTLAQMMVLQKDQTRTVLGLLALTALFAAVLVVVATAPLRADARRLEEALRTLEAGNRSARSGVTRSDELGNVARAVDSLSFALEAVERERTQVEAERTALLSNISHDLRTPLAALRAALDAIIDGVAPDPDRYLRSMQGQVEALAALVDDLFLLARLEAGTVEVERELVDLSELADAVAEALEPVAHAAGVSIILDAAAPMPVQASATQLGRIMANLLDNAIRHAPPGSAVQLRVSRSPGWSDGSRPTVEVIDEGPGFPGGFSTQAFDRFSRADASRTRATGGAGLGLAIARGLVEANGGRIWIDPPPGGRVSFELPAV